MLAIAASPEKPHAHEGETDLKLEPPHLKKLISEAAAMDRRLYTRIVESGQADPEFLIREGGENLTCYVISIAVIPDDLKAGERRFIEFGPDSEPSRLDEAFDPGERGVGLLSILHPQYIHDLKWEASDEAVTGTFHFRSTNGVYNGKAGFIARYIEGGDESALYVSEFILQPEGVRFERGSPEKKWKRAGLNDGP